MFSTLRVIGLTFCLVLSLTAQAQIGLGGQPHPSSVLDLKSPNNNQGLGSDAKGVDG
jgi:hypothetical protein